MLQMYWLFFLVTGAKHQKCVGNYVYILNTKHKEGKISHASMAGNTRPPASMSN